MKLSETLRSVASHAGSLTSEAIKVDHTAMHFADMGVGIGKTIETVLNSFAAILERSPFTLPGVPLAGSSPPGQASVPHI